MILLNRERAVRGSGSYGKNKEKLSHIFGTTELIWMKFLELITSSKATK